MGGHEYINTTWGRHLVSAYTGLDFYQVGALDYGVYLLWLRDAYIYALNQTEAGRAYLDECWRLTQTKADKAALRKHFGKGVSSGGR